MAAPTPEGLAQAARIEKRAVDILRIVYPQFCDATVAALAQGGEQHLEETWAWAVAIRAMIPLVRGTFETDPDAIKSIERMAQEFATFYLKAQ